MKAIDHLIYNSHVLSSLLGQIYNALRCWLNLGEWSLFLLKMRTERKGFYEQ